MIKKRYDYSYNITNNDLSSSTNNNIYKIHKSLAKQKYYWSNIDDNILTSKEFNIIIGIRKIEAELYTMALSIAACNSFSPVVRLPPGINLLGSLKKDFVSCSRANNNPNKQKKINRLFKLLQLQMSGYFYPEYADLLKSAGINVKIISDAPLEWLPLNGLPLMLRKNTSRIPVTPGNMMFIQVIKSQRLQLKIDDLKKILVIRSFSDDDNLKNQLTRATEIFGGVSEKFKIEIIFKDINNVNDFINAINEFDGAILIYDGHGSYDKDLDMSGLIIGGKFFNVWELKNKIIRMPPIVLLSACDTHPLDSSHVTVSNGFLSLGAITVFSTLLPITGKESAVIIGRLIYRLEEYLPVYFKIFGNVIRWSNLISGLQRMMYMTEIEKFLCSKLNLQLDEDSRHKIGYMFNHYINSENDKWYEKSIDHFSNETGTSIEQIQAVLKNGFFCETLKYIQIGNPENIVIHNE